SARSRRCSLRCASRTKRSKVRVWASVSACLIACTQPVERSNVRVQIDADKAVRDVVDEVQVVVETQAANTGWETVRSRRFEPKATGEWPLDFPVEARDSRLNFLVTATARDDRGAVVAEARALRDAEHLTQSSIFLHFEAACVRRMELCPKGRTC